MLIELSKILTYSEEELEQQVTELAEGNRMTMELEGLPYTDKDMEDFKIYHRRFLKEKIEEAKAENQPK